MQHQGEHDSTLPTTTTIGLSSVSPDAGKEDASNTATTNTTNPSSDSATATELAVMRKEIARLAALVEASSSPSPAGSDIRKRSAPADRVNSSRDRRANSSR